MDCVYHALAMESWDARSCENWDGILARRAESGMVMCEESWLYGDGSGCRRGD